MSTKKYLQNGKWPGLQPKQKVKLQQVEGDLEIDVDIEKQITQLQEASCLLYTSPSPRDRG